MDRAIFRIALVLVFAFASQLARAQAFNFRAFDSNWAAQASEAAGRTECRDSVSAQVAFKWVGAVQPGKEGQFSDPVLKRAYLARFRFDKKLFLVASYRMLAAQAARQGAIDVDAARKEAARALGVPVASNISLSSALREDSKDSDLIIRTHLSRLLKNLTPPTNLAS